MKSRYSAQVMVAAFQCDVPPKVEMTTCTPGHFAGDPSSTILGIELDYLDLNLHLRSPQAAITFAEAIIAEADKIIAASMKTLDVESALASKSPWEENQ